MSKAVGKSCVLCKSNKSNRFYCLENKKCSTEDIIFKLKFIINSEVDNLDGFICSSCLLKINKSFNFIRDVKNHLNLTKSVDFNESNESNHVIPRQSISWCYLNEANCDSNPSDTPEELNDHVYSETPSTSSTTISQPKYQSPDHDNNSNSNSHIYSDSFILLLISLLVNNQSSCAARLILSTQLKKEIEDSFIDDVDKTCKKLCEKAENGSVLRSCRPMDLLMDKSTHLIPDILNEFSTRYFNKGLLVSLKILS